MNNDAEKLQQAVVKVITETVRSKISWSKVTSPPNIESRDDDENLMAGIGALVGPQKKIIDYYEADYAGLHWTLFSEVYVDPFEQALFQMNTWSSGKAIPKRGKITLQIKDGDQTWSIPTSPRVEELLEAVRQYSTRTPPSRVIDQILRATP